MGGEREEQDRTGQAQAVGVLQSIGGYQQQEALARKLSQQLMSRSVQAIPRAPNTHDESWPRRAR